MARCACEDAAHGSIAPVEGHQDSASGCSLWQIVQDSTRGPIDRSYLVSLVRERYLFHALPHARTVGERSVLPKPFASTVASAVWMDATGSPIAPSKASRTPTLTSIGQYLSRLTRVAADPEKGLDALSTSADFREAETRRKTGGSGEIRRAFEAHAFEVFEATLSAQEREAIRTVRRLIHENGPVAGLIIKRLSDTP